MASDAVIHCHAQFGNYAVAIPGFLCISSNVVKFLARIKTERLHFKRNFLNKDPGISASAPSPEALADLMTASKSFADAAANMP